ECVDATCPYVKKIQRLVSEINNSETIVLIAGDALHPEVQGIINHCNNRVITFKTVEELEKILMEQASEAQKELIMVSQTTFNGLEWEKSTTIAKKVCTNIKIFDTICKAT
ncbi:MAG: bifunctional 4-hydroxy-3-methylbut-2-enyl diphosphate reductase/30S ribosomal protein S1, partial [Oscillospiraceae bacterium]